ncbi:unnamed protein product [Choristocarpus tenellus]
MHYLPHLLIGTALLLTSALRQESFPQDVTKNILNEVQQGTPDTHGVQLRIAFPKPGDGVIPSSNSRQISIDVQVSVWRGGVTILAEGHLCFDIGAKRQCLPMPKESLANNSLVKSTIHVTESREKEKLQALLLRDDGQVLARSPSIEVEILSVAPLFPSTRPLEPSLPYNSEYRRRFLPIDSPWETLRPSGCSPGRRGQPVKLAVGVVSGASNIARRKVVRETWLSFLDRRLGRGAVQYRFFIGIPRTSYSAELVVPGEIVREIEEHGDVVVMGHEDTYASIYYRALGIFRWGVESCDADFVMRWVSTVMRNQCEEPILLGWVETRFSQLKMINSTS